METLIESINSSLQTFGLNLPVMIIAISLAGVATIGHLVNGGSLKVPVFVAILVAALFWSGLSGCRNEPTMTIDLAAHELSQVASPPIIEHIDCGDRNSAIAKIEWVFDLEQGMSLVITKNRCEYMPSRIAVVVPTVGAPTTGQTVELVWVRYRHFAMGSPDGHYMIAAID